MGGADDVREGDILTFDGFFGATFNILIPRWLPTMGKSVLVEKFQDDYVLSAREKPYGPKAKLLVVELAGRPE